MRFPKPLFPGARVALLSASGIVRAERLPQAADAVRSLGLEPVIYPSCRYENRTAIWPPMTGSGRMI